MARRIVSSVSSMDCLEYEFVWHIEHYKVQKDLSKAESNEKFFMMQSNSFRADVFTSDGSPLIASFCIQLYPDGVDEAHKSHAGVFLCLQSLSQGSKLLASSEFTFGGTLKCASARSDANFHDLSDGKKSDWGYLSFCKKEEIAKRVVDGTLTVSCAVLIFCGKTNSVKDQYKTPLIRSLSDRMFELLKNEQLTDVTLINGDKNFKCHQAILQNASSVLSAMFSKEEFLEGRTKVLHMNDVSPTTVECFLQFIYTGECENCVDCARELVMLGDKYAIEELKAFASNKMVDQLSVASAAETWQVASMFQLPRLKEAAVNFIMKCLPEVVQTDGWKAVAISNPDIMLSLIHI